MIVPTREGTPTPERRLSTASIFQNNTIVYPLLGLEPSDDPSPPPFSFGHTSAPHPTISDNTSLEWTRVTEENTVPSRDFLVVRLTTKRSQVLPIKSKWKDRIKPVRGQLVRHPTLKAPVVFHDKREDVLERSLTFFMFNGGVLRPLVRTMEERS